MFKYLFYQFVLFLLLIPYSVSAQNDVVGIYFERLSDSSQTGIPDYNLKLSSINAATGSLTEITNDGFDGFVMNKTYTLDPSQNVYYFSDAYWIYAVDTQTGDLLYQNVVQLPDDQTFQQMIYNEVDQQIYGLRRTNLDNYNQQKVFLSQINPSTGNVTDISVSPIDNLPCITYDAALDPINGIYYYSDCYNIVGIDINTGVVVSQETIVTPNSGDFLNFKFNVGDQMIYGIVQKYDDLPYPNFKLFLAKIDPQTGIVEIISQQPLNATISFNNYANRAIDPINEIFYFESLNSINSVDMQTGDFLNSSVINFEQGDMFDHFYYRNSKMQLNINEFNRELDISIYPLPADNYLNIETKEAFEKIKIYDFTARLVYERKFAEKINIAQLEKGIYFLDLINDKGQIYRKKIAIK